MLKCLSINSLGIDLLYTTQNLLRTTFTMSCQHFPPKHIFEFLVNQCWKLIQRCSLKRFILKVSLSFLSSLFQHMHRSMSTLKIRYSKKHVQMALVSTCLSKPWFKESVFHIIVSFLVDLCISKLQSSFGEISENCDCWSKMRFFTKTFEIIFFGSNCSTFILQLNAENRINIRAVYNEIHVSKLFCMGFIW